MELSPAQVLSILNQVHDMREAQNNYFAHRTDGNLKISKRKEQIVDNTIAYFIKKGVIKPKQKTTSTAPQLFNQ
jgi:hypothetical protein